MNNQPVHYEVAKVQLEKAIQDCENDIWVVGPARIGKTHLLAEFGLMEGSYFRKYHRGSIRTRESLKNVMTRDGDTVIEIGTPGYSRHYTELRHQLRSALNIETRNPSDAELITAVEGHVTNTHNLCRINEACQNANVGRLGESVTDSVVELIKSRGDAVQQERAYLKSLQAISLVVGRKFAVDVGYEDLPDVVAEFVKSRESMTADESKCVVHVANLFDGLEQGPTIQDLIEWNGEGLPPVGVKCEISLDLPDHEHFQPCLIEHYKDNRVWVSFGDSARMDHVYWLHNIQFRPIETTDVFYEPTIRDLNEWKNGDECLHSDYDDVVLRFIGVSSTDRTKCHVEDFDGEYVNTYYLSISELTKPEQRAERERREAAYDLYCAECAFQETPSLLIDKVDLSFYFRIVDKTGYRK